MKMIQIFMKNSKYLFDVKIRNHEVNVDKICMADKTLGITNTPSFAKILEVAQ